uniref:RAD51 paralog B n=1 Tax=Ovis aries TaxID=9940 RepID=A0AC11D115_SHEEP
MGSKKLRRVGLSQELCDRLNRHQIVTCQDFLCLSPLELMKMTGLSYQAVHELLCVVSRACAPQMQTAYEIKTQRCAAHSSAFLSTTLPALDEALHGGVACGSLTEESYDKPRQCIEKRDITLLTKVHIVKAVVFPVVMYGCESWTVKKAKH